MRKTGRKIEPLDQNIDFPVGDGFNAALSPQVKPYGFKIAFGIACAASMAMWAS